VKVIADEQALMQVLDNLVSNAVKYSPHGKNVYIKTIHHTEGQMAEMTFKSTPLTLLPSTFLRIEITDEGPGISEEDMKKLFGKFARLSAQPTGGEHSTGLGLSIVKKMVEGMRGRVWCESEQGNGATFIVELPMTLPVGKTAI
jgi:signal transduction histidine kinase